METMLMEKPISSACLIDLYNRWEVMKHFRDLVNIGPMLQMDVEQEIMDFRHLAIEFGWSLSEIKKIEEQAYSYTIYEQSLPHIQKEAGDRFEWMKNRSRWVK